MYWLENLSHTSKGIWLWCLCLHSKENRSKLDKKEEKCIFIGYKDGMKGYNIWNLETKKVMYSWDVVFRGIKDVVN
jgi:hypothetical protein